MSKYEMLKMFFDRNESFSKEESMKKASKKFNIKENTAQTYYYRWKKEFMNTGKCVPKEEKKEVIRTREGNELKIQHFKAIKGKHGIYIKEDGTVRCGEEVFRNEKELEAYKKREIKNFYEKLSEILDVMMLEV